MIDTVQAVLLLVIVLLTILLLILGIQVYFILKELRVAVHRTNKVLENAENITESVSQPMSFISGLLLSTKSINSILKFIKHKKKEED